MFPRAASRCRTNARASDFQHSRTEVSSSPNAPSSLSRMARAAKTPRASPDRMGRGRVTSHGSSRPESRSGGCAENRRNEHGRESRGSSCVESLSARAARSAPRHEDPRCAAPLRCPAREIPCGLARTPIASRSGRGKAVQAIAACPVPRHSLNDGQDLIDRTSEPRGSSRSRQFPWSRHLKARLILLALSSLASGR